MNLQKQYPSGMLTIFPTWTSTWCFHWNWRVINDAHSYWLREVRAYVTRFSLHHWSWRISDEARCYWLRGVSAYVTIFSFQRWVWRVSDDTRYYWLSPCLCHVLFAPPVTLKRQWRCALLLAKSPCFRHDFSLHHWPWRVSDDSRYYWLREIRADVTSFSLHNWLWAIMHVKMPVRTLQGNKQISVISVMQIITLSAYLFSSSNKSFTLCGSRMTNVYTGWGNIFNPLSTMVQPLGITGWR